jgi:hypothetical protein
VRPVIRVLLTAFLLTGCLSISIPAFASCNPNRSNDGQRRWDGTHQNVNQTVGGAYAEFSINTPYVYSGFVADYVMLTTGPFAWSQIGFDQYPGGSRDTFVEWTSDVVHVNNKYFGAQPANTYHYFTALYNNPAGNFGFKIDSTLIYQTAQTFTPTQGEASGESTTGANQMLGGYNVPQSQINLSIYYGGAWHGWGGSPFNDDSSKYGNSQSGTSDSIWDVACSS